MISMCLLCGECLVYYNSKKIVSVVKIFYDSVIRKYKK